MRPSINRVVQSLDAPDASLLEEARRAAMQREDAHRAFLERIPAFRAVEQAPPAHPLPWTGTFRVAAFNAERLKNRRFTLFDTQMATDHTRSLGAVDIPRTEYFRRLKAALKVKAAVASLASKES